jgi:hypothetical protein
MSFIDVTRYGGLRTLRVAVAAIAYLDVAVDGAVVHLIGGETIRVNEDMAEIEARCTPAPAIVAVEVGDRRVEFAPALPIDDAPPASSSPPAAPLQTRKGRR